MSYTRARGASSGCFQRPHGSALNRMSAGSPAWCQHGGERGGEAAIEGEEGMAGAACPSQACRCGIAGRLHQLVAFTAHPPALLS